MTVPPRKLSLERETVRSLVVRSSLHAGIHFIERAPAAAVPIAHILNTAAPKSSGTVGPHSRTSVDVLGLP